MFKNLRQNKSLNKTKFESIHFMHTLQPEKLTKLQKSQKIFVEGGVMVLNIVSSSELIFKFKHVTIYRKEL